jgi:hypothetical protein
MKDEYMSQLSWQQRILYGLTNWGLFAAGFVQLAPGRPLTNWWQPQPRR